MEVSVYLYATSALEGGGWSGLCLSLFTTRNETGTYCAGGKLDLRAGLDGSRNLAFYHVSNSGLSGLVAASTERHQGDREELASNWEGNVEDKKALKLFYPLNCIRLKQW